MNAGILSDLLHQFVSVATLGYAAVLPDALKLMSYLVVIEIVILGLWWALGKSDVSVTAIKKVTAIGFFLWIINNMHWIVTALLKSFGQAGLLAGGNVMTISDLLDPSKIVDFGFNAVGPLFAHLGDTWSVISSPANGVFAGLAGLLVLLAYFAIGCQIFITIVEFYIFTVCSVMLVPFAVFKPTAFLAEKAIGGTFGMGVKFMVLAFIIGLCYGTLRTLGLSEDPTFHELFVAVLGSGAIAFLAWHAPSMAAGMISGSGPRLTVGAFFGSAGNAGRRTVGVTKPTIVQGMKAVRTAIGKTASGVQKLRGLKK